MTPLSFVFQVQSACVVTCRGKLSIHIHRDITQEPDAWGLVRTDNFKRISQRDVQHINARTVSRLRSNGQSVHFAFGIQMQRQRTTAPRSRFLSVKCHSDASGYSVFCTIPTPAVYPAGRCGKPSTINETSNPDRNSIISASSASATIVISTCPSKSIDKCR